MKKHIDLDTLLTEHFSFLEQSGKSNRMKNDLHVTNKTTTDNGSKKIVTPILKDSIGNKVIR
jgi:hypothetical protein